jgi:hypothetical protein
MPTVALTGTLQNIVRSDLLQENLVVHAVPWAHMRTFDAYATPLAAAPTSDDLGLSGGTHGTATPMVISTTSSGTTITQKLRFEYVMPAHYIPAGRVYIRLHSRVAVAAAVSATVDVICYESNSEAGVSADLCITGATTINSDVWADKDFILTATALTVGSRLDVLVTVALDDTGGANACIANIGSIEVLFDSKG